MSESEDSIQLRVRLLQELARRLYWGGVSYALFASLSTPWLTYGRRAGWIASICLLITGVWRTVSCRRLLRLPTASALAEGKRLVTISATQGILFGLYVAGAFYVVHGSIMPELLLMLGVAGLSSVGASLFGPLPRLATIQVTAQLIPAYIWAIFALPRYGWVLMAFVCIHLVSMVQVVRMTGRHVTRMFQDQLALEKHSADLRAARDAAEQASFARMRFLANMSHEIRTPLNGIIGLAQVLTETSLNEEQRGLVGDLSRSGGHLLAVVNDILDMAKVSSGKLVMESVRFELPQLIRDVAVPAAVLADAKDLQLNVEAEHLPALADGDPVRLRQVISNLLSNAVKFTESGGVSLTALVPRGGWLRVEVRDTGIGLSDEQMAGLFQDFHQVDSSTTRRFGGTGLGLAISWKLVEMMGGHFEVESALGQGSCFAFEIPLTTSSGELLHVTESDVSAELPPHVRVLVVEDNAVNRTVMQRILARRGALVDIAENGRIAVDLVSQTPYDIILMDCQMPEMDGYEATAAIRGMPGDVSHTPIVGVTAGAFREDGERCRRAGMDGYISKPVSHELLLKTMSEVLGPRFAGDGAGAGIAPAPSVSRT